VIRIIQTLKNIIFIENVLLAVVLLIYDLTNNNIFDNVNKKQ
jgi:hypothetical protein